MSEENKEKIDKKEELEESVDKNVESERNNDLTIDEKLKETEDKLLRSLAEIENQRRRFEKETREAFEFGGFNFAKETLSLLDNLQRAQISIKNDENLKENKDLDKFLSNINILEKDLITIFEKNNIKKIECLGLKFDPNLHQAMLEVENDEKEPGTILKEIQAGFMFGKRLLRPSFVGISKKKMDKNDNKKDSHDL
jgi:molecular chaperone GrpE